MIETENVKKKKAVKLMLITITVYNMSNINVLYLSAALITLLEKSGMLSSK